MSNASYLKRKRLRKQQNVYFDVKSWPTFLGAWSKSPLLRTYSYTPSLFLSEPSKDNDQHLHNWRRAIQPFYILPLAASISVIALRLDISLNSEVFP